MRPAVVEKRDRCGIDGRAVYRGRHDTSAPARWVGHGDLVAAVEEPPGNPVLGPRGWNARVDDERLATPPKTENAFDAGAIHPAGRPGVPTPSAASGVWRPSVDVASHHVGFRFVASHVRRRAAMVDRVQHVEELRGLITA